MDTRGFAKIVTPTLKQPQRRWPRMVEYGKEFASSRTFNTILSAVAAVAAAGTCLAVIVGWLSAGATNTHDIQALQGTVSQLSMQVSHLADKIDQGPRSDQMKEIDRHLSALDGRMDGDERRLGTDEQTLVRVQTQVESIQSSSDATLRSHAR